MVFRVEKNKNYTIMANFHLREKTMSLKAKGLLSWMLSNTDNWDYSIAGIVANCKENETAIRNTLKELQEFGYLEVKKIPPTKDNPKFHYEYIVHEEPQGVETLGVENLHLDNLGVENQVQRNTKQINTNIRNTKEKNNTTNVVVDKPHQLNNNDFSLNNKPKQKKENLWDKCFNELCKFTKDEKLKNKLVEYLNVWIKLKDKHPNLRNWQSILKKLQSEYIKEDWIAIIDQSIRKEYATFCPLSSTGNKKPSKLFNEGIKNDGSYDLEDHSISDLEF